MTTSDHTGVKSAIAEHRVLPVVTVEDQEALESVLQALTGGGLPLIELTLRTPYSLEAITTARAQSRAVVGAGSIRAVHDARAAVDAGAQFLVPPSPDPDVLAWSDGQRIPVFPGVATPSEALVARRAGLDTVKFFPASVCGGPSWVKAVSAPIPDIAFLPTGGIDDTTFEAYLAIPSVIAVGGSWFLDPTESHERREARVANVVERARRAGRPHYSTEGERR